MAELHTPYAVTQMSHESTVHGWCYNILVYFVAVLRPAITINVN